MRYIVRIARSAGLIALFLVAALLGIASGVLFAYAGDLPQISALDDYAPSTISRVYGSRGEVIGEFAIQRRDVVAVRGDLAEAAAGDHRRRGRRLRAALRPQHPAHRRHARQGHHRSPHGSGASTLTQQLARKLFLTDEKTPERKIKEAILAIQIEKRYTKREIFTLYCNQMYFGHGVYGVEAASRLYFGKSAKDLTLEEAALIAGILQGNVRQSPYVNMEAALRRRNYALGRMADVGYITAADADAAKKTPIVLRGEPSGQPSVAPYFLEEVRKELESRYGAKQLYENGLSIQTGARREAAGSRQPRARRRPAAHRQAARLPEAAPQRRRRRAHGRGLPHARWDRTDAGRRHRPGRRAGRRRPRRSSVRAGALRVTIDKKGFAWTRQDRRHAARDAAATWSRRAWRRWTRPRMPPPPRSSSRRSSKGPCSRSTTGPGRSRRWSAASASSAASSTARRRRYRQVGSAFKPIVYTAAIDRGYTPATILMDTPTSFPGAAGSPAYAPQNYDHKFEGPVTLRHALEDSRNIPAVRVMEQLGPRQVIAYARRLGLESPLPPYLAVALGAAEATLIEMTSAYSVFPNQGVRMRPYPILKVADREGNVLEENRPEPKDAIRADTAFVMTNLLRGVVQRGTAAKAAALNWPVGGKTGTTDDYTDAWFIGFDPDITIGVWIGLDQKKPIGHNQTGARSGAADLDRRHEGVDRRSQGAAGLRRARQHRLRVGGQGLGQPRRPGHAGGDLGSLHRRHPAGVRIQAVTD